MFPNMSVSVSEVINVNPKVHLINHGLYLLQRREAVW